jgi:Protein of unknown function (DUF3592)
MSLWVLFFLWAVAAVLIGIAVTRRREARRFAASATRAQGVVVELVQRPSPAPRQSGHLTYPVVRYNTTDGREVVFRSGFGARPSPWQPGQPVTVLYDPADPQAARIESGAASTALPGCFGAVGVAVAVFGTLAFLFFRWADSLVP